jgi:hypothetical protein
MTSTERVRNFRARHGLAHVNRIGTLKLSGVRPPAPLARRARKVRLQLELAAHPAAPPPALPAPAVTVQIPGMNIIGAIPTPSPLPVQATIPPFAAKSLAA